MNFFIKQGSTEPIIKMKLINDGKSDKTGFYDLLENCTITFTMTDIENDYPKILNSPCSLGTGNKIFNITNNEYYIVYKFNEDDTSEVGKFEGLFTITFLDDLGNQTSKLIVPIREKLIINII